MWSSHRGEPGRDRPTLEEIARWRRRHGAPDNEIPAGVGVAVLLGHTEEAAVGITQLEAFSAGFRFTLAVRLRRPRAGLAPGGLYMLIGAHIRPDTEIPPADRLLLGLEYANGDRASTLTEMDFPGSATVDDGQLILTSQSGGGGDLTVDQSYWVSPLPPAGPVTFVLSWPGFGMPESRAEVDGALIREAAARSVELWPEEPLAEPPEPTPPPRPDTGWFSYGPEPDTP
ncbi:hypothetical protein ODJ79_02645 [Actinoplanes sp. KI2]|uniref:hypothetical protein n=1 Tax=Actinoplanes sp. KI2 TaxID=2983315 RepID=UPI0021D598E7|nr:hypothetical protein [Actinoplanes sp. KI2]MCU7722605.1 hypothetical protein [Actinoplanes sp. KI2]